MKKLRLIWAGALFILALTFKLHAQEAPDSIVQMTAQSQGLSLVSPMDVPEEGTFWLVMSNGIVPDPGPMFDPNLPVYAITTNGQYLVDDTDGQVVTEEGQTVEEALAAQADEVTNLINQIQNPPANQAATGSRMSGRMMPMDGGDFTPDFDFDTNGLYLQINVVSNGLAYLDLFNATDSVYEIISKQDLEATNWTIEPEEVWPTNTNAMPFTIQTGDRTNLFIWAMDWTDITSNGNETPDWWFYYYYGAAGLSLSDYSLDSQGYPLWYDYENGLDPNVITFSVTATNNYVNTILPTVQISVLSGIPSYIATLVDDTNFSDATWSAYTSSNITADLGSVQGWHDVWVGLKGLAPNATATWQYKRLKLDTVLPSLTITNPAYSTVAEPVIQLQGYSLKALSSLTYDITNADGWVTNQPAVILDQYYDTNALEFTTNYFQCFDVPLTNGLNTIILHAADLSGNVMTTNFDFTLDYSGKTNPPVVQLYWPQNGELLSGTSFTLNGNVSDPTATVSVQTVTGGMTNAFNGLVGRDGNFWVSNLPLNAGTNFLTLEAVDAASNVFTTNLMLIQSSASLTINGMSAGQTNATGTISAAGYTVWVNGAQATQNGDGTWSAQIAPIGAVGGLVEATAVPDTDNGGNGSEVDAENNPQSPDATSTTLAVQPASGYYISYFTYHEHDQYTGVLPFDYNYTWQDGVGGGGDEDNPNGYDEQYTLSWPAVSWPQPLPDGTSDGSEGPGEITPPFLQTLHCNFGGTSGNGTTEQISGDAQVKFATGGPLGSTGSGLYWISAGAREYPPPWVYDGDFSDAQFVLIAQGSSVPVTAQSISMLGQTVSENGYEDGVYALLPDNSFPVITAAVSGSDCYNFYVGLNYSRVTVTSLTVVSNATEINATNWAAVKMTTNDYVYLQATVSNGDTNAAALIQWSGGEAVPGNPFERRVSKATSAKTMVMASLGSSSQSVNIWVVWANLTIKTSGTLDPDDKAELLVSGNWPTPTSYNVPLFGGNGLGGGSALGPIDCLSNTNLNYAYTVGKMEAKAILQPTGIGKLLSNTNIWNMNRTNIEIAWDNGGSPSASVPAPGGNDTSGDFAKYLNPTNDDIFDLDTPGCSNTLPGTNINHTAELYENFYEYVTVNLGGESQICSDIQTWSYTAQVDVDSTNKVQLNSLSASLITIPTTSHYTQR